MAYMRTFSTDELQALREATEELQEEIFDEIRDRCGELERHRTRLRELTAQLCREREQQEVLRKRVTERKVRREKIIRLHRACAEIRARRGMSNGMVNGRLSPTPDSGINGHHYPNSHHHSYSNSDSSILGGSHRLTTPLHQMNKRDVVAALRAHNPQLEQRLNELRERAMESTYRRIISLCTHDADSDTRPSTGMGMDENMEEGIRNGEEDEEDDEQGIDGLRTAVESEPAEVQMGRVRSFLRKIREPEL